MKDGGKYGEKEKKKVLCFNDVYAGHKLREFSLRKCKFSSRGKFYWAELINVDLLIGHG